jgi:hypothetical protein
MNGPESSSPVPHQPWLALLALASSHATDRLAEAATWTDLERTVRENEIPVDLELLRLARPEIETACRLLIPGLVADFVGQHRDEIRAVMVECRQ